MGDAHDDAQQDGGGAGQKHNAANAKEQEGGLQLLRVAIVAGHSSQGSAGEGDQETEVVDDQAAPKEQIGVAAEGKKRGSWHRYQ